jgi:hypothetical protein
MNENIDLEKAWDLFQKAVMECLGNEEFMKEYRRLTGSKLWLHTSPIEKSIDESTGYDKAMYKDFCQFVFDIITHNIQENSPL